ncbi:MAG: hypothetical protein VX246_16880 [Myxococcota bacterium]|nr:hypothetical protein [Myxococcota bacterium]
MRQLTVPNAPIHNWRERLLWMSLSVGLIALMLLGLVSLAQWGERSAVARSGPLGIDRLPGSTALAGELLIPNGALVTARRPEFPEAPVALPAVSASIELASTARFQRGTRWKCHAVPGARTRQAVQLVERNGRLCAPGR